MSKLANVVIVLTIWGFSVSVAYIIGFEHGTADGIHWARHQVFGK